MADDCHIALLRAVNVGGTGKLPMVDLAAAATAAGLADVTTVLQTGNLLFRSSEAPAASARALTATLLARSGLTTEVFVRTRAAWTNMLDANPFAEDAARDPARCVAMVLADRPKADVDALRGAGSGGEKIALCGSTAFLVYPDGIGRSKLTSALIERRLGTRGTARNWNTVVRIAAALAAM